MLFTYTPKHKKFSGGIQYISWLNIMIIVWITPRKLRFDKLDFLGQSKCYRIKYKRLEVRFYYKMDKRIK